MTFTFTKIENGKPVAEMRELSVEEAAAAVYEAMHGASYKVAQTADSHAEQALAA